MDRNLITRAVLFVEQTPMGELARGVRDQLQSLGAVLGYRIRVVERTGRNILTQFPQTSRWGVVEMTVSRVTRGENTSQTVQG